MSTNASGSPVLSLLIPIYNVQRYLRECLDSALAQTLKDIEIICINDGRPTTRRRLSTSIWSAMDASR